MKISNISARLYERRFLTPLSIAGKSISHRTGLIIMISSDDGVTGYGEAAPLLGFSRETVEMVERQFAEATPYLRNVEMTETPDKIFQILDRIADLLPSLRFGLETALCDLAARRVNLPMAAWLSPKSQKEIAVNYLVDDSAIDPRELTKIVKQKGHRTIKIKMFVPDQSGLANVRRLREAVGPEVKIRIDANRGWRLDDAIKIIPELQRLSIEYVEEPLRKSEMVSLKKLRHELSFRVAFDESLAEADRPEQFPREKACDVVILKPTLLGGISSTMRIADSARQNNIPIVLTSAFEIEIEIGMAALVHLAAALPGELLACGLDTMRYFDGPIPSIFDIRDGAISVPDLPGLGLEPQ